MHLPLCSTLPLGQSDLKEWSLLILLQCIEHRLTKEFHEILEKDLYIFLSIIFIERNECVYLVSSVPYDHGSDPLVITGIPPYPPPPFPLAMAPPPTIASLSKASSGELTYYQLSFSLIKIYNISYYNNIYSLLLCNVI